MNGCFGKQVAILALFVFSVGCAGSSESGLLDPVVESLAGTWQYTVMNADSATFTGCTEDAVALNGMSVSQAMLSGAPICAPASQFSVVEAEGLLSILPHEVSCSDGSTATVTGIGALNSSSVSGQWDSLSIGGVNALQSFSGSIVGNNIDVSENARTFAGTYRGTCEITPALSATVRIL